MQARWDLGSDGGPTKDEVISAYIGTLRQNSLDGTGEWKGLTHEEKSHLEMRMLRVRGATQLRLRAVSSKALHSPVVRVRKTI